MHQQPSSAVTPTFDALIPAEMAARAEELGVQKAGFDWPKTLMLSILAGAFIAQGALFATTVTAGSAGMMSYGVTKLLGGLVFSLGLILVVVAGAELFTGNNLIVMAWASRRVSTRGLLRNWAIVYFGNLIGAVATAVLMYASGQYRFHGAVVGLNALAIADAKCRLDFGQAVALGIGCNALVCLAVWLCFSARSTTDKIMAIVFPITAFVAAGMEHCVANMYFIPIGLFIKNWSGNSFWELAGTSAEKYSALTWENFVTANLIPVTLGNIFGGAVMVGVVYWFIYLRKR